MRRDFPLLLDDWSRRRSVGGRRTFTSGAAYVPTTYSMRYSDSTELFYSDSTPALYIV